jgi:hypothetical protein
LIGVYTNPNHVIAFSDGEVRQEFSHCFYCEIVGGEIKVSNESYEVAFFPFKSASITRFNTSMQLGFEGAGLLRLKKSGAAVPVLQRSLSSLHPSSLRRRSTLLTDMGKAHALQGDVKTACTHFHQALDIIAQTKVLLAFQRMYSAQRELDQWKYDPQVEALAEHITNTLAILRRTNNG